MDARRNPQHARIVIPALLDLWGKCPRNNFMWNPKTCGKSLEISGRWPSAYFFQGLQPYVLSPGTWNLQCFIWVWKGGMPGMGPDVSLGQTVDASVQRFLSNRIYASRISSYVGLYIHRCLYMRYLSIYVLIHLVNNAIDLHMRKYVYIIILYIIYIYTYINVKLMDM